MNEGISITVGPGEFIDRLTIFRLKSIHLQNAESRDAITAQLSAFESIRRRLPTDAQIHRIEQDLAAINLELWEAEEDIRRLCPERQSEAFMAVAQRIPALNDQRARLKSDIDRALGWRTTETKSYNETCDELIDTLTDADVAAVGLHNSILPTHSNDTPDHLVHSENPVSTGDCAPLIQCKYGRFVVNPNDIYIGRSLALYGEFSPAEASLYHNILAAGNTVVDAGANIGWFTLMFASHVGCSGRVYAFEPQRQVFQMLCANLALNGVDNVEAWPAGLGAQVGEMVVPPMDYRRSGNFGGVSLCKEGPGERVPITTIDNLGLDVCHLIKADVQGMEFEVLLGAADTIARCRPLLYVENDSQTNSARLLQTIDSLGYRAYWHLPSMSPENSKHDTDNVFRGVVSVNLLCTPPGMHWEMIDPNLILRQVRGQDDWWQDR